MKQRPLIGIITSVLAKNHIRNIVRGAIAQIQLCGCDCVILSPLINFTQCSSAHAKTERIIFRQILSDQFDGFLYIRDDAMGSEVIAEIEKLLLQSNKYVMTVDDNEHSFFDNTQYDDYDDFGKVVRHLIEVHGYRKIYCLTGPETSFQAQNRLQAYQDIMTEHGLYYDDTYYTYGTFWVDSAMDYAKKIISGKLSMPEAIICGNDVTAMSLIKSFKSAGIQVPKDIAIAGYEGFPFTANIDISLTTCMRDNYQLGADATRRLYRNLTGILCNKVNHRENRFIVGNSCGCDSIPVRQLHIDQNDVIPKMLEEIIYYDDMAFDLETAKTIPDLLYRTLGHMKILYQAKELRIFLYVSENQMQLAASGTETEIHISENEEIFPNRDIISVLLHTNSPKIIFLSLLHLQEQQFGMIALSFNQYDRIYDRNYQRFVSDFEVALNKLYRTHNIAKLTSDSIRQKNRDEQYEKLLKLRTLLQNEPGQEWTIEKMCSVTNMSRSTMQKYYKAYFRKSVFEELILFRVEMAKKLLEEHELSLKEITVQCGYSTESYFMKQFKSVTGITPTSYRNRKR